MASVIVKRKLLATITDSDGNYKIAIENDADTETLVFLKPGYETREIEAKAGKELNVQLVEDKNQKKEGVEVIGYGINSNANQQIRVRATGSTRRRKTTNFG
jgi:hypothetical protein